MNHKPKMSAEDARTFDTFSQANYQYLLAVLTCGCEPYQDIFTLRRWNAQGYRINKGEKAHKITVYITRTKKDDDGNPSVDGNGNEQTYSVPRTACVFCRCQVSKRTGTQSDDSHSCLEFAKN